MLYTIPILIVDVDVLRHLQPTDHNNTGGITMAQPNGIKKPLTSVQIKALKPEQTLVDTGENVGLRIICGKRGAKTFFYRYRSPVDNKLKQMALGQFVPAIDEDLNFPMGKKKLGLSSARQLLGQLKIERNSGICPSTKLKDDAKKQAQKERMEKLTIERMVEVYLSQRIENHHGIDNYGNPTKDIIVGSRAKVKNQKEARRSLEAISKKEFGQRLASKVTHVDIKNLINSILVKGFNVQAGIVLNELSLAYNYCIGRPEPVQGVFYEQWLPYLPEEQVNPCIQAKMFFNSQKTKLTPKQRKRVLDDSEIATVLKWLPGSKMPIICKHALFLTLYTGVRSGEAVDATKAAFDLEKGTWLVKGKTGADRYVQLSYQVVNYLKPILEDKNNTTDYLLPASTTGKPQVQKQLSEQLASVRRRNIAPDIPHWVPHDLRRSCRTGLSRLKCPSNIAEAVLGHSKKGIEGTYDLYQYEDDCAEWLQKWADHLDMLMGKVSNVVSISREA